MKSICLGVVLLRSALPVEPAMPPDNTCFQTASPYGPAIDIGSDMAIVYGVNDTFAERVAGWREHGYNVGMMTGIAWGGYGDYYMSNGVFKKEEVQTAKDGRLFMHGNSTTVGYNVPSDSYIAYIKRMVEPAVDAGVAAIFLEEPEYWAKTGWSEGFKQAWQQFYGEPWAPPDASVDAQYRASRLKYELYYRALKEVFAHVKARAKDQGREIDCVVPTHSLINYAQWRIVSPESHLVDLDELDGYIAQVWTGTARSANKFRGVVKERTFETAYLEYGQMLSMVRPTGRKVWFLADPVEDNPNRSWNDYKRNYECTVVASLLWPEVHRYEVMPWPRRIFKGAYPKVDLDEKAADREGIPADYASEILVIINALNEMGQKEVRHDTGTRGIGLLVSDTMMFQRAEPSASDPHLGGFYGLALPLLKAGVPVEPVQLETTTQRGCLRPYKVLLLTYEHQKPLKPGYHEALRKWVRKGGCLLFVGEGADPYHHVRAWWNDEGRTSATARDALVRSLDVSPRAFEKPVKTGRGYVHFVSANPSQLQENADGADKVLDSVRALLRLRGQELETQNHLCIRRGPFVVAAVLDESVSEEPLRLDGPFIDLFDPALPIVTQCVLHPNERALLYDLIQPGPAAGVLAAAARVKAERVGEGQLAFTLRGPEGTTGAARVRLPRPPTRVATSPDVHTQHEWDEATSTLWLSFPNRAGDVVFTVNF